MKLQLPVHHYIRCAFQELLEQGRYAVCKGLPNILVHLGLPVYLVGPPRPTRSCSRPCLFLMALSCRQPGGDRPTVSYQF